MFTIKSDFSPLRAPIFRNETSVYRAYLTDSAVTDGTMRTVVVIFVLAMITIALEVYSDAGLTSVSHTARPDPVTLAIAHGLKRD